MIRRAIIALMFAACIANGQDWNTLGALWTEPVVSSASWTPLNLLPMFWHKAESKTTDAISTANDGAWDGAAKYTNSVNGNAYLFTPTKAVRGLTNAASSLAGYGGVSVAAWVLRTVTGNVDQVIYLSAENGVQRLGLRFGADNKLTIYSAPASSEPVRLGATTNVWPCATWTHFVGVADIANDRLYVYCNGVLDASISASFTLTAFASAYSTNTSANCIGYYGPSGSYPFRGAIDDVMIIPKAMTSSEVTQLYQWRQ